MKKEGSVLILVVIIYSIMTFICYQAWQSASLSYEAATLRYRQIKHDCLVDGLVKYGMLLIKSGQVDIKELKVDKEQLIFFDSWPQVDGVEKYQGKVLLTRREDKSLSLRAVLLKVVVLREIVVKLKLEKSKVMLIERD